MTEENLAQLALIVYWRTGRKVGRTIYAMLADGSDSDPLIGVMDTPALAQAAVEAHNHRSDEFLGLEQ